MANIQFNNFAATTLASGINGAVLSLDVAAGTGALFPSLSGSQYFYCVLSDTATGATREIIKVTARSTDTFTIVRAQEGTSGTAFIAGDKVELRLTEQGLIDLREAPVSDANALVEGSSDATKKFRIEVDGFTTGNTRVMTPPDSNFTAARIDAAQTFTGTQTFSNDLEIGHASDTTLARTAAGVLAVEGNVLKQAGKETVWIPAGAMVARTTNGAAAGSVESTTNKVMLKTLDFDTTTIEYAQFNIQMPKSWNESTVTAAFTWTANSSSTNSVSWAIQGVALSDDDAIDTAYGTAQQVSDANKNVAYDINRTAATGNITIAGTPAAEDWVSFQVYRDTAGALGGTDDLAADALLIGVTLYYTTDAVNDA